MALDDAVLLVGFDGVPGFGHVLYHVAKFMQEQALLLFVCKGIADDYVEMTMGALVDDSPEVRICVLDGSAYRTPLIITQHLFALSL